MIPFSAATRQADLERMAQGELDVLVIGGGITGAGVALDAASRGLSVGLVEREDFAAGTSGRSSRMIHGGVRYLERLQVGLVYEGLRERAALVRLAPHLVYPLSMYLVIPSFGERLWRNAGLGVYDLLATGRNLARHRRAGEEEIRRAAPGLARPTPGLGYVEARTDDARVTLEVARAAHAFGAMVANHAAVEALLGEGRVRGAEVRDRMFGEALQVRARVTVNATGVWAEQTQALAAAEPRRLRPSKGIHLVFRPGAVAIRCGVAVHSAAGDGRFVFALPWGSRTYAGTTDTAYEGDLDAPEVTEDDRDYVLHALGREFPGLSGSDVVASWAGLRPLLDRGTGATADLSRRHAIYEDPPGFVTITGGKFTAFRSMAEEVLERIAGRLGNREGCRTKDIPLGLTGSLDATLGRAVEEGGRIGLAPEASRRMVYRYGDDWVEAVRLMAADRGLAEPVVSGLPVLAVERELARSREMALTEADVLVRRTRLTTMDGSLAVPG